MSSHPDTVHGNGRTNKTSPRVTSGSRHSPGNHGSGVVDGEQEVEE